MKKTALAKRLTLMIAAMMCISTLSSCGGGETTNSGDVQDTGSQQTTGEGSSDEKMTLQIQTHTLEKLNENQPVWQELEKKFNVEFEFYQTPDKEALNLRIASGDLPDTIRDQTFIDYHNYIDQGIFTEVPVEVIKENAPNLSEWVEREGGGEQAWDYFLHDGKNYSVPILWSLANQGYVLSWRSDMLEMAGFSEENPPVTLEDMEKGLQAIHDQAGISPLTATDGLTSLSHVFGAYDVYLDYYEKDGKIVYGPIEPEAKEALTVLNRWYEEGLLDPEFMINKFDNVLEKWSNDQAAVVEYYWWDLLPKEAFFDGRLYECNEERGLSNIIVLPPQGPEGDSGMTQGSPFPSSGLQFTKVLEGQPEKIAKYLQVFDATWDRDLQDYMRYGIEGETYNYTEETGVEWIPPYDDQEKRDEFGIGLYSLPGCFNDYDFTAKYDTQPQYLELRQESEKKGIGQGGLLDPFYRPVYNEKAEILDKLFTNAHIDFITGARSLDEFDAFVEEWLKSGGQDVLDEAQKIYDENFK